MPTVLQHLEATKHRKKSAEQRAFERKDEATRMLKYNFTIKTRKLARQARIKANKARMAAK